MTEQSLFGFTQKRLDRLAWKVVGQTEAKFVGRREAHDVVWDAMLDYLIGAAHSGNVEPRAGFLMTVGENRLRDVNRKARREYLIRRDAREIAGMRPFAPDFAPGLVAERYLREVYDFLSDDDRELGELLVKYRGNQAAVARAWGVRKEQVNRWVSALRQKILGKFPDLLDSWPSDQDDERTVRRRYTSPKRESLDEMY
jgi:DNA-directed RNA polymerase specialized sigma24 family protein